MEFSEWNYVAGENEGYQRKCVCINKLPRSSKVMTWMSQTKQQLKDIGRDPDEVEDQAQDRNKWRNDVIERWR